MNDLMEWWRYFYGYIRLLLAIASFGLLMLVMFVVLYAPLWILWKIITWIAGKVKRED